MLETTTLTTSQPETGGAPYFKILTGIGTRKSDAGLKEALQTMPADTMKDGSYAAAGIMRFQDWTFGALMVPGNLQAGILALGLHEGAYAEPDKYFGASKIIEEGTPDEIFAAPRHPIAKALLPAVPH